MTDLSTAVSDALDKMCGGGLPATSSQGTAFASALTLAFAPTATCPVLYCRPDTDETKELMSNAGIHFTPPEFLVDFLVVQKESATKLIPLVACESEMQNHEVSYRIDPQSGYVWDFVKLLHFRARHLVFAAMVPSAEEWMPKLESILIQCAEEYAELWSKDRLSVVLLPTLTRHAPRIRLGEGRANGGLEFWDFKLKKK